jgi:hypothetical protein
MWMSIKLFNLFVSFFVIIEDIQKSESLKFNSIFLFQFKNSLRSFSSICESNLKMIGDLLFRFMKTLASWILNISLYSSYFLISKLCLPRIGSSPFPNKEEDEGNFKILYSIGSQPFRVQVPVIDSVLKDNN